ncbi:conserved hypothetical protein [anaerobic digester metagenome]|uniref:Uncharacterized protein n=1 Tax=anaerobic digester metagenome TaxID=1263854 RepID=A0A485M941_9ZZZZ
MEFVGLLAPFALVLALGAYAQAAVLRKEVSELKKLINRE